jgi:hypothetical protein
MFLMSRKYFFTADYFRKTQQQIKTAETKGKQESLELHILLKVLTNEKRAVIAEVFKQIGAGPIL